MRHVSSSRASALRLPGLTPALSAANLWFGAGSGLGGPLGGFISDRFGWRTAFLCACLPLYLDLIESEADSRPSTVQLPILVLAAILVFRNLRYRVAGQGKSKREMVRRIDYLGSLTLVLSVRPLPLLPVARAGSS